MKKITKRENFETLRTIVLDAVAAGIVEESVSSQLNEFIEKELVALDKRASDAKKYANKKKAQADELTELVNQILNESEGAMTIPEIVAKANELDADVQATPQKLTYRLNKLVEDGLATKEQVSIKTEGKPARKVNAYTAVKFEDAEE